MTRFERALLFITFGMIVGHILISPLIDHLFQ